MQEDIQQGKEDKTAIRIAKSSFLTISKKTNVKLEIPKDFDKHYLFREPTYRDEGQICGYLHSTQAITMCAIIELLEEKLTKIVVFGGTQIGKSGIILNSFFLLPVINYLISGRKTLPVITLPVSISLVDQCINEMQAAYDFCQGVTVHCNGKSIQVKNYFKEIQVELQEAHLNLVFQQLVIHREKTKIEAISQLLSKFQNHQILSINDESHYATNLPKAGSGGIFSQIISLLDERKDTINISVSATPAQQSCSNAKDDWEFVPMCVSDGSKNQEHIYYGPVIFNGYTLVGSNGVANLPEIISLENLNFLNHNYMDSELYDDNSRYTIEFENNISRIANSVVEKGSQHLLLRAFKKNETADKFAKRFAKRNPDWGVFCYFDKTGKSSLKTLFRKYLNECQEKGIHNILILVTAGARMGTQLPSGCVAGCDLTKAGSSYVSAAQGIFGRLCGWYQKNEVKPFMYCTKVFGDRLANAIKWGTPYNNEEENFKTLDQHVGLQHLGKNLVVDRKCIPWVNELETVLNDAKIEIRNDRINIANRDAISKVIETIMSNERINRLSERCDTKLMNWDHIEKQYNSGVCSEFIMRGFGIRSWESWSKTDKDTRLVRRDKKWIQPQILVSVGKNKIKILKIIFRKLATLNELEAFTKPSCQYF